ncbi:unnamed protein product [Pieris macdunnoughi]|uniref:Uncharacterized protein n=1 Tax=Pieris macdunnoughi TaxID=345717 RepID=A0A821RBF6_9NEOP|nr:unnamed protein product [Pieris macdunnoughi]
MAMWSRLGLPNSIKGCLSVLVRTTDLTLTRLGGLCNPTGWRCLTALLLSPTDLARPVPSDTSDAFTYAMRFHL